MSDAWRGYGPDPGGRGGPAPGPAEAGSHGPRGSDRGWVPGGSGTPVRPSLGQPAPGPPWPGPLPAGPPPPGPSRPGVLPAGLPPAGPHPVGPARFGPGVFAPGALGRPGSEGAGRPPAGVAAAGPDRRGEGRDGPAPRHLAPSSAWPRETGAGRAMPTRRRGLNWLMLVPVVMQLAVPLYNRDAPRLFGLPFFYWYQLACVFVTTITITFIYLMTRARRPRW